MQATGQGLRYLVFRVGAAALAVALPSVLRILRPAPLTRVPHAPGGLEGVLNLGHEIVPVLSLRRALGLPPGPRDDATAERVVLLDIGGEPVGLRVDAVSAIRVLPDEMQAPALYAYAGIDEGALSSLCETGPGELVGILNVPEVLSRAFARPLETS